jgi:hypothetical protein
MCSVRISICQDKKFSISGIEHMPQKAKECGQTKTPPTALSAVMKSKLLIPPISKSCLFYSNKKTIACTQKALKPEQTV